MNALLAPEVPARSGTTRERLLDAAIEMFAERGYAATGVDALCRKAGVAKTGLYWEFQNKVGLLNAVVDQVVREWVDEISDAARQATSPGERLDITLSAIRTRVEARPEMYRVLLVVLAERTQVDEEAREALARFYKSAHAALFGGIQESVGGVLPEAELGAACDLILAMIQGVFLRVQVYGPGNEDKVFGVLRTTILLLVRELMVNMNGQSTLLGRAVDIAAPIGSK